MTFIGAHARRKTRAEIRSLTRRVRLMCGLTEPRIDVERLIDFDLPRVDSDFYYTVEEMEDMGENLGLADPEKKTFMIRADVYQGMRVGVPEHRQTVLHEVGHLFLHTSSQILFARTSRKPPKSMDPEWQADTFADELAAPPDFMHLCSGSAKDFARLHGIPPQTAWQQLHYFTEEGLIQKK